MESIPGFETSHQDLFEDEMQTRMEALSTQMEVLQQKVTTMMNVKRPCI